ncbi:helix-turn-helix transcriptional regulator [Nonomuraea sp. NPDC050663]|uniref:helix-turn-helix transcriptional regulator n=1 Tax=Nonomuraea sp. NPDC050663 TaxID=3364370 RepID=UPI0037897719
MTSHHWRGWCLLRPGLLLLGGSVGSNDLHAHHAVQLLTATEPFTMADAEGGRLTATIAVVPPDAPHTIVDGAREALLVLVDPRSAPGRALLAWAQAGVQAATWAPPEESGIEHPAGVRRPLMFTRPPEGHARSAEAVRALRLLESWTGHGGAADVPRHPAVDAAIEVIPAFLRRGPVRLGQVAEAVHVSPSWLAHLFSAHVGIPLRPYVRWLRLQRAIGLVAAGQTLTAAAHSAGFTDSPHFTRAFRESFGNTPSELAAAIDWVP